MKSKFSKIAISLPTPLLKKTDKQRGDTTRSAYIKTVLENAIQSDKDITRIGLIPELITHVADALDDYILKFEDRLDNNSSNDDRSKRRKVKVLKSVLERARKEERANPNGLLRLNKGLLLRSEQIEELYFALSLYAEEKEDMLAAADREGDKELR